MTQNHPPRRRRRRYAPSILLAAIVLAVGLSGCDINGNIGSKGLGCGPTEQAKGNARPIAADNSTHGFYADSLTSRVDTSLSRAINEINTTHVDPSRAGSLSAQTDVRVMDSAYTDLCNWTWFTPANGGMLGLTQCVGLNSAKECEQTYVRISTTYTTWQYASDNAVDNLLLHESLHTLGLVHLSSASDVMHQPPPYTSRVLISSRNRKAINGYYE